MAKLIKTSKPGIFRAHRKGCVGEGRCDCPYTVVTRHRGKQVKTTVATFGEARELKGRKDSGESRPSAKVRVEAYFDQWIETYAGRTSAGFQEVSRDEYRPSDRETRPAGVGDVEALRCGIERCSPPLLRPSREEHLHWRTAEGACRCVGDVWHRR